MNYGYQIIGRCSICGGEVKVFTGLWGGTVPPTPFCSRCGGHAPPNAVPVFPMQPKPAIPGECSLVIEDGHTTMCMA